MSNLEPVFVVAKITGLSSQRIESNGARPMTVVGVRFQASGAAKALPIVGATSFTGTGRDHGAYFEELTVELPVPAEERKREVLEYVSWVESEAQRTGDASSLEILRANRSSGIIALERLYHSNRVGNYRMLCRAKLENGTMIDSQAVSLRIRDNGKFFDQPAFRQQPAAGK